MHLKVQQSHNLRFTPGNYFLGTWFLNRDRYDFMARFNIRIGMIETCRINRLILMYNIYNTIRMNGMT